ncbi:hypothetical protein [Candidatus Doolittlea endobia]|uniref:hypothetical protein n=1 Tax=Candidatus Doolittlea endobia TaxID=1778262 RepID=UPI0018D4C435
MVAIIAAFAVSFIISSVLLKSSRAIVDAANLAKASRRMKNIKTQFKSIAAPVNARVSCNLSAVQKIIVA